MVIEERIGEVPPESALASPERISLARALGEILAVYVPSFGLGILSAILLLHNPGLGNDQVTGAVTALEEILQYVMQASVTIFGVAFFCLQRGVRLSQLFGRTVEPRPYPASAHGMPYPPPPNPGAPYGVDGAPGGGANGGFWPGYGYYMPPAPPTQRGRGWQFSRAYFVSMAGVLGFLLSVIVYTAVTNYQSGAPSQGDSPYLIPTGLVVALAAGFGEEMLVTGLVVNALESAGFGGKRAWVIYVVAICLRIPYHLYYGWAAPGVIIFTVVNIWVYRRWRLLWPIVLAHVTYDFIEYLASVSPSAVGGLLILGLGMVTLTMVIIVLSIELSDRSARRRYAQYTAATEAAYAAQGAYVDQHARLDPRAQYPDPQAQYSPAQPQQHLFQPPPGTPVPPAPPASPALPATPIPPAPPASRSQTADGSSGSV